ncbi:MAG: PIN domain-containing protein [Deltaproteobacteria bacterium]|nr:PIN domain-containing protein [Deltaproteobacteria bacterium]
MVLVDTSVWITLYRKKDHALGQLLWSLVARNAAAICGQIWVEFIGGFRTAQLRAEYAATFASFEWLPTDESTYRLAADLLATCPQLGSGDVIIAATAITHDVPLLTGDTDFQQLVAHGLQLVNTK